MLVFVILDFLLPRFGHFQNVWKLKRLAEPFIVEHANDPVFQGEEVPEVRPLVTRRALNTLSVHLFKALVFLIFSLNVNNYVCDLQTNDDENQVN